MSLRIGRRHLLRVLSGTLVWPAIQSQEHAARAQGKITLTYWRHFYEPGVKLERQIAQEYMALHPNIQVTVADQGSTPAEHQKILIAFAGGGAPDIVLAYNGYFPQYATLGFFQPINYSAFGTVRAALEKQWFPGALAGWEHNGQYYGIPSSASTYLQVISPPLFKAAGLDPVHDAPRTWEDIARIGPRLTKTSNGAIVQQALALPSYPGAMALVFHAMVHQLDGSILSDDGKTALLNSPACVKALQTFYDFVNKYKISVLAGKPEQGAGFDTGSTAIVVDVGLWYRGHLRQAAPTIYNNGDGLRFLPFPRFQGGKDLGGTPYGYAWCVNAHSPHAKEAWDFVRFLSDKSILPDIALGNIAPKAWLLTDKEVMSNPDTAVAVKELASGVTYAAIPDQVSTIMYAAISHSLLDRTDPKQALDTANQQLQALLPTLPYKLKL